MHKWAAIIENVYQIFCYLREIIDISRNMIHIYLLLYTLYFSLLDILA